MLSAHAANEEFTEKNSIKFRLHVVCRRKPEFASHSHEQLLDLDPESYLDNSTVLASHLKWEPLTGQAELFKDAPCKPLFDNIIVAKLRENQVR